MALYHTLTLLLCPFPSGLLKNTVALDNRQFPQESGLKQTLSWRVFFKMLSTYQAAASALTLTANLCALDV